MNAAQTPSRGGGILDRYEPVIGLEVHCQLATLTKLFCGCSTAFGALPNHHTCPVCLGHPGALPVINTQVVDYAIKLGLAVDATIAPRSVFARKQYFYPDLPKGYQISQYELPYCTGGSIRLESGASVDLNRIHIEEDAGKNVHGDKASYVDLNRAGIPLLEIVTEPVLHSPQDAADYLKRLRGLVRHLEISDGNLEEGSFRCDANVSLRPRGETKLGTRAEVKNLNSFRNIEKAITYEIMRQADLLDHGDAVVQETRLYDATSGKTASMRSKEETADYRYFPDPDLKPLMISSERVEKIKASMPELPSAMAARYVEQLGLTEYDASVLTADRDLAMFFEAVLGKVDGKWPAKKVANWIMSEYLREAQDREWDMSAPPINQNSVAELLLMVAGETISGKIAKKVFKLMIEPGGEPQEIVEREGLVQVTDEGVIKEQISAVLDQNQAQVEEYLAGKEKLYGYFVGQIMKVGGGKLNPDLVNKNLKQLLNDRKK